MPHRKPVLRLVGGLWLVWCVTEVRARLAAGARCAIAATTKQRPSGRPARTRAADERILVRALMPRSATGLPLTAWMAPFLSRCLNVVWIDCGADIRGTYRTIKFVT